VQVQSLLPPSRTKVALGTDQFDDPGRAISQASVCVCVCVRTVTLQWNDFAQICSTMVQFDCLKVKVTSQNLQLQNESVTFLDIDAAD